VNVRGCDLSAREIEGRFHLSSTLRKFSALFSGASGRDIPRLQQLIKVGASAIPVRLRLRDPALLGADADVDPFHGQKLR
jgi:hypothetical protein